MRKGIKITILAALFSAAVYWGIIGIQRLDEKAGFPLDKNTDRQLVIHFPGIDNYYEKIIRLDDNYEVDSEYGLEFYADNRKIGDKVMLTLQTPSGLKSAEVKLIPYYNDSSFIIISAAVGFLFILTGLWVGTVRANEHAPLVLFCVLVSFGLTIINPGGIIYNSSDTIGIINRILHAVSYVAGIASFLYFCMIFPVKPLKNRRLALFIFMPALIICAVYVFLVTDTVSNLRQETVDRLENAWDIIQAALFACIVAGILVLRKKYIRYNSESERNKIQWIFWGLSAGTAPFLMLWVIPSVTGLPLYVSEKYLLLFLIIVPLSFTIAVLKYRLFDISVVIKRSFVYTLLTILIALFYLAVISITGLLIREYTFEHDYVITVIASFIIAFLFNPVKTRLNIYVDRLFYREKYDFEKDVSSFAGDSMNCRTAGELASAFERLVQRFIPLKSLVIITGEEDGKERILVKRGFPDIFRVIPVNSVSELSVDTAFYAEDSGEYPDIPRGLKKYEFKIAIPVKSEIRENIGLILGGGKMSDKKFSSRDLNFLKYAAAEFAANLLKILLSEKLLLNELERSKLGELNEMKSEFVSHVSHELKTPLTSISICTETLLNDRIKDSTKNREYMKIISGECERLQRLVNNLLDFARIEKGLKEYSFVRMDLRKALEKAIEAAMFIFEKNKINIVQKIPKNPVFVSGDFDALIGAVINLLSNAVKYSADADKIETELKTVDEFAYLSIKDYGIGIPEAEQAGIFEKYYRLKSRHSEKEGTGLGLAIVKHTAESHGGNIIVSSSAGSGSTFILKIPVAEQ